MHEIAQFERENHHDDAAQLCRRCRFHPASPRIAGYCSWDCHDADDEEEADDEGDGGGGERAA